MISVCNPLQARRPTALALGSFDGIHSGHRSVISKITNKENSVPTVVSFWPHPREVLFGESRLRLYLPSEKTLLLEPLGIQQLVLVPFNLSLAALSAEEFFHEILIKKLQAKHISVGANFRFGKGREGNTSKLQKLGEELGIEVIVVDIIKDQQGRMSSSRIRSSLKDGDLTLANKLLGREYTFEGTVVRGKGLGKKIGWPTANLQVNRRKLLPKEGVYAVLAKESDKEKFVPAVMNLGPQPTIDLSAPSATEVHILNSDLKLEGKQLVIKPIKRIRNQKKFKTMQELSEQIKLDANMAISILT